MKAIEFKARIDNNKIHLPDHINLKNENVKVILLYEEGEDEDQLIINSLNDQFLKGFSEPDSIYDKE